MTTPPSTVREWTHGDVATVAFAVKRAPSVHNTQPWVLEFGAGVVSLFERGELSLPWQDATGRDRLISCGAALTNLLLAVRVLGWDAHPVLFPDRDRPDEVARVALTAARAPSDLDSALHAAIPTRRSHRMPFQDPVPDRLRPELIAAGGTDGVAVHPIHGPAENAALATLLEHAGRVLRQDRDYQRELLVWTNVHSGYQAGGGLPRPRLTFDTLPWAGLVRSSTGVPHASVLADRLSREFLLLLHTPDDGPADHVRAGQAAQRIWLAATDAGLAGSILTQPLQVPETRAGVIEQLELPGFPQALLRFGFPSRPGPPSPRLPISQLIR
ncbi:MAG TPA: nitroreductase family protein [Actinophytocola sp.]|uniref:Acg family FMN-binding oxidoreductase n=1 Tax=Actinophytocola sp. TaxID=1872138 RepID=UPI002DB9BF0F|nr:nitroreductase family protein [Actinophytocola sp.]HEU5471231.1 nitroreductase family protein [Actinophytocola sp.]